MGPALAAEIFKNKYPEANSYIVELFGSLALTGKGHLTDWIIKKTLEGHETEIIFDDKTECTVHPNTFDIEGYKNGEVVDKWRVYSIGGGSIKIEGENERDSKDIYDLKYYKMTKKEKHDLRKSLGLKDSDFVNFLKRVWEVMKASVETGLTKEGIIPGKLKLDRRSKFIYESNLIGEIISKLL